MPVLLVRHAQALPRSTWETDDRERPLSARGRKQSRGLVAELMAYKPATVLSSPYVRCVDTVRPLAEAVGLDVKSVEALAEGELDAGLLLVRSMARDSVVMCSHGDIIPAVLDALAREDGVDLGRSPRWAKASVWVLQTRKGKFVTAKYLPPP